MIMQITVNMYDYVEHSYRYVTRKFLMLLKIYVTIHAHDNNDIIVRDSPTWQMIIIHAHEYH